MAANKSVTVLVPNGRRQNVKVSPNTTMLQVLEEVCRKHGYNADDYDLKHFNNILDINAIYRFTGLSNNAQLEMVACTKSRCISNVTIGIQLENGERIMGEFKPETTLMQILKETCPAQDVEKTVLIYMHREICGREALENTSLRALGLNGGKAILRLINRDSEQPKIQAHVQVPLVAKSVKNNVEEGETSHRLPPRTYLNNKVLDPITLLKHAATTKEVRPRNGEEDEITESVNVQEDKNQNQHFVVEEESTVKNIKSDDQWCHDDYESNGNAKEDVRIEFLGERNALVFNQAGVQALPRDELPDNFFDLTVDDAKTLLRDVKRRREELDEAPLVTDAQRQLDQNKRMLDQLHKYRHTVIRIQFRDQFVLQGLFKPLETVQTVMDFIKNYLDDPCCEFTIYTTPPKHILTPTSRIIDEKLVPSAIVHYTGSASLREDVKARLTDPKIAGVQAIGSRMKIKCKDNLTKNEETNTVETTETDNAVPGPSGSKPPHKNTGKAPKWFKPFK